MRSNLLCLLLTILFVLPAQATLTLTSVTGVSSWSQAGTDTTSSTTSTRPTITGGYIKYSSYPCTQNGTSTCDSCATATTSTVACNRTGVYPTLKMIITVTSSATITANTNAFAYGSSTSTTFTPTTAATISGSTVTYTLLWSEVCTAIGSTSCEASVASGTLTLALDSNGGTTATDTLSINLKLSYIDATSTTYGTYTSCPNGTESGGAGLCYVEIERGDQKVYINNLVQYTNYPASPTSGPALSALVMFYKAMSTADLSTIGMNESYKELTANTSASPATFSDNRITGLDNNTQYCFRMANKDLAGNIFLMTPTTASTSTMCATPSKVVGLLDDKHCFIATAAFGSEMAPEVESFRQFRNHFLLKTTWGTRFVKWYYHVSPPLAEFISRSEFLKATVRVLLWPLLIFAKWSVEWGLWWTVLGVLTLLAFAQAVGRQFKNLQNKKAGSR